MTSSDIYRILFIGDVVGRPGREALDARLPRLIQDLGPLFVIVNGENAAGGVGITSDIAKDIYKLGADAITLGNHAFNKREICAFLDEGNPIVRPANMPPGTPGKGLCHVEKEGIRLAVANLCGRTFMEPYDDPFREVERLIDMAATPHMLLDFHAEATSEKIAMAWNVDGRVSAIVGTHTHVATADERVLPNGTAAITDVGMTGPMNGVLGMDRDIILGKFRTGLPARFEVAKGAGVISGVVIDVERESGKARAIERVRSEA